MEATRWVLRTHSEMLTVLKTPHSVVMDLSPQTLWCTQVQGPFLLEALIVESVSIQPSPKMCSEVVFTLPWMFIVF